MKRTSITFVMMIGLLAFSTQSQAETKTENLYTKKHNITIA
ncbi:MAG: hypothetical protein ACI4NO_06525 [Oxalobacter sp.]